MSTKESLPERIKWLLRVHGRRPSWLAKQLSVTEKTLRNLLAGNYKTSPRIEFLQEISAALGVPLEYLATGLDSLRQNLGLCDWSRTGRIPFYSLFESRVVSDYYIRSLQDSTYKRHMEEEFICINQMARELSKFTGNESIDIVSFTCPHVWEEIELTLKLNQQISSELPASLCFVHPSERLLSLASRDAQEQLRTQPISLHCHYQQAILLERLCRRRVFCLFYTIAHIDDGPMVLQHIGDLSRSGDILVMSYFPAVADAGDYRQVQRQDPRFNGAIPDDWDSELHAVLSIAARESVGVPFEGEFRIECEIPSIDETVSYSINFQLEMKLASGQETNLSMLRIHRHDPGALNRLLQEIGWRQICSFDLSVTPREVPYPARLIALIRV